MSSCKINRTDYRKRNCQYAAIFDVQYAVSCGLTLQIECRQPAFSPLYAQGPDEGHHQWPGCSRARFFPKPSKEPVGQEVANPPVPPPPWCPCFPRPDAFGQRCLSAYLVDLTHPWWLRMWHVCLFTVVTTRTSSSQFKGFCVKSPWKSLSTCWGWEINRMVCSV